jgi:hypothetical protein
MQAMPGNPVPEGASPTTAAESVEAALIDKGQIGTTSGGSETARGGAVRSAAERGVPEPRGGAASGGPATPAAQSEPAVTAQDSQEADAARHAAYEASVMAALGGRRGVAEAGLPTVAFIVVYTPTRNLNAALWSALAIAGALTLVRLLKRDKVQFVLSGLVGVLASVLAAKFTGRANNFYLPGVFWNAGEAVFFAASALARWPAVGVVLGPVTGEMMAWRGQPERLRAFTRATWMLAGMFVFRVMVEVPLYLANQITALGAAKVLLGYPLYLIVAFVCWQVIRKAPPPART